MPQKNNYNVYDYFFKELYFFQPIGNQVFRYDIKKAYRTILSIFWKNFDKKEIEKIKKSKKLEFNKSVGYCAYRQEVYDARTGELVSEKKPKRPDILFFCTRFLKDLKEFLQTNYKTLIMSYVDAFGFSKNINYNQFLEDVREFQRAFYINEGLDVDKLKYEPLNFHFDFFEFEKKDLFFEFFNTEKRKKYFFENKK